MTAILLTLSFPPFPTPFFAWIAFIPIYCLLAWNRPLRSIPYLGLAGIAFYVMHAGWVGRFHPLAPAFVALVIGLLFFLLPLFLTGVIIRYSTALAIPAAPAIWVVSEFLKASWYLKFPFGMMGTSQYHWPRLIQYADCTGVWGVSFLIILVNIVLFYVGTVCASRRRRSIVARVAIPLIVVGVMLAAALAYGTARVSDGGRDTGETVNVVLAQTRAQSDDARSGDPEAILGSHDTYLRLAATYGPDLVVFPENTLGTTVTIDRTLRDDRSVQILNGFSRRAAEGGAALLIGTLEAVMDEGEIRRHNAAYLFDSAGNLSGVYRKRELVPFGEFYPFGNLFGAFREDLEEKHGALFLDPGREKELLQLTVADGRTHRFAVLICFESTQGGLARDYARAGADFLVVMTDDSWSQSRAAMYQNAVFSVFRAIETRTPVIRVGTGGLSAFVTSSGHLHTRIPVRAAGVMAVSVPIETDRHQTFYSRHGDWFVLLSAVTAVAAFAACAHAFLRRGA